MVSGIRRNLARGVQGVLGMVMLAGGAAASVSFTATLEPSRVAVGRTSVLTVTLSADTQNLPDVDLPALSGADVEAGGTSQQFSMVNSTVSMSKTWRWRIRPRGRNNVPIPALEVTLDGHVHRTDPLVLEVIANGPPGVIGNGNRTAPPTIDEDQAAPDMPGPGDDHFVTLEVDRDQAFVGEQVVLTFRYYQALQASGFERPEYTAPRTEGFWREDLGEPVTRRTNRSGIAYQVTEIRYSLVPTRPGDLLVEPARVVLPQDPFANFFSRNRRSSGPQELWTSSAEVHVSDLPAPRPENFSGLVSRDLSLSVTLDRDTIPQGEAVSVTLRIQADGSLKSVSLPGWDLPEDFQVHEAGSRVEAELRGGRLRGTLEEERILQPLAAGSFELPPVELVSFDPSRGEYVTTNSPSLTLVALPSDFRLDDAADRRHSAGKFAEELAFVHTPDRGLRRPASPLPERRLWWAMMGAPLLLLAGFRAVLARQDRDRRDPVGRRRRQALQTARDRLQAAASLSDPATALGEAAAAVRMFVADREGRPAAAVDTQAAVDHLRACLDDTRAERARMLMERCAGARFGQLEDASRDAQRTLAELRELVEAAAAVRSGTRSAVTGIVVCLVCLGAVTSLAVAQAGPEPSRLLAEGNQAYTAGDLDTALARYRQVAALTEDPDVLYDLGNAHARRGELGRALVSYRRALRLAPRDGDLRRNLDWVRDHAADRDLAASAAPSPVALFLGAVALLSLDEWSWLLVAVVWALAAGVAFVWWRGGVSVSSRRFLLGLVVANLIVGAVVVLRWYDERVVEHAVVVVPQVVLRGGPDESFPEVLTVSDGLEVRIEDRREAWCQVGLGGDWRGWLPVTALAPVRRIAEETP